MKSLLLIGLSMITGFLFYASFYLSILDNTKFGWFLFLGFISLVITSMVGLSCITQPEEYDDSDSFDDLDMLNEE